MKADLGIWAAQMPSGKWKVIIWGHHDEHLMDWLGCNYRYVVVQGQPYWGFGSQIEAMAWWNAIPAESQKEQKLRVTGMSGTFMGDGPTYKPTTLLGR